MINSTIFNEDLKLSLLIYGIDISDAEQTTLEDMYNKTMGLSYINVVRFLSKNDLFLINNKLIPSSKYNNNFNDLEKKYTDTAPKYVFKAFGTTSFILNSIKDIKNLEAINYIISIFSRHPGFTAGIKNNIICKSVLGTEDLVFDDESKLHDFIFDMLKALKITSMSQMYAYSTTDNKDLNDGLVNLGWSVTTSTKPNTSSLFCMNDMYSQITKKVFELNNWRLFVLAPVASSGFGYQGSSGIVNYIDKTYNYIDVDRVFFDTRSYTLNRPFNDIGYVPNESEFQLLENYYQSNNTNKLEIITKDLIDNISSIKKRKSNYENRQKTLAEVLKKKIAYKIELLKKDNESFKLNDIEYTRDSITYSGQELKILSPESKLPIGIKNIGQKILESLYNEVGSRGYGYNNRKVRARIPELKDSTSDINSINDISFDVAYDEFTAFIVQFYLYPLLNKSIKGDIKLKIGDVIVELTTVTSAKNNSMFVYLNSNKVTKDDLVYCIHQAISFATQTEYDEFLKSVSYTSLKIHKLTKAGIQLNFYDSIMQKYINLSIPVTRIKNRNYLIINNKQKSIKRTASILTLANKNTIMDIVKVLVNKDIVNGVKYEDLKGFIENGQKAYEEAVEKTKKFVDGTLTSLGVTKHDTVMMDTGTVLNNVYKIKGNIREYYVETSVPYRIYSAKEGRYICMLDKTPYVSPEVKLINRLYALKNDSVIATEVATLNF